MRVLVVGGGIGGLATAIALARGGHEPLVFERASALEAVGAGIALSPNAVAALERLGVADEVRRRGHAPRHALVLNRRGRVLSELPYAERGWEMLGVHRADLQEALVAALPERALRLGRAGIGFELLDGRVRIQLAGGGVEEGEALIGADGIHSVVRAGLFGDSELRYSGHAAWRAVTQRLPTVSEDRFSESWGAGARFGFVPIGGRRLYWFVAEDAPDGAPPPEAPLEHLRRRFADWGRAPRRRSKTRSCSASSSGEEAIRRRRCGGTNGGGAGGRTRSSGSRSRPAASRSSRPGAPARCATSWCAPCRTGSRPHNRRGCFARASTNGRRRGGGRARRRRGG